MSKLILKPYICLKVFTGVVKEVRKEVCQGSAPCCAHSLVWSQLGLYYSSLCRCCIFSCQLICSHISCLSLLALILQWLFLSALKIVRKVGKNFLLLRFSAFIFFFQSNQVKLSSEVCCLPAKHPCCPELPCGPTQDLHSSVLS